MTTRSDLKTPDRGTGTLKNKAEASPAPQGTPRNVSEAETVGSGKVTTPEERRRLIAQSAYLKAERRCFQSNPEQDWLEAEAELDTLAVDSCSPGESPKHVNRWGNTSVDLQAISST